MKKEYPMEKEYLMKKEYPMEKEYPMTVPNLTGRRARRLFVDDCGAATAEYAIATMAAVAFAGLLVVINHPPPTNLIDRIPPWKSSSSLSSSRC